ncbi:hypothetical protein [Micromonospora sp. NPDC048842]|uniref:hypothetical protein n=1 Tax=unclassified Micromonospora TaxID=2617518 RepID=UPI00340D3E78
MTSFPATARRVRDESLSPRRRRSHLRDCLYHFAPYGFHATWHHLATRHRIPRDVEGDPPSLVRALGELETARALVLARAVAFAAQRRLQKQAGRRTPTTPHPWDSWGCHDIAYCPDPRKHPTGELSIVVERVLDAYAAGVDLAGRCLVCGDDDSRPGRACRNCGVVPDGYRNSI